MKLLIQNPLLARGMADFAWEAYALASENAGIDIDARDDRRVVQAIGDAAASKGYHHADGVLGSIQYTAAADLSVRGLTRTQIATWLECLCEAGFVAFYRNWPGNQHIHANYAGLPQKRALDGQNEDFFNGRDGLVGRRRVDDEWWFPEKELRRIPEAMFRISNGRNPRAVRSPLAQKREQAMREAAAGQTPAPEPGFTYGFCLNDEAKPRFWMPVYEGVSYAPVRAFGSALGFDTVYVPEKRQIEYDGQDVPVALKVVAGVGHAPVRQLVREVGLKIADVDASTRKVVVTR